jgi:hypothetical protein
MNECVCGNQLEFGEKWGGMTFNVIKPDIDSSLSAFTQSNMYQVMIKTSPILKKMIS